MQELYLEILYEDEEILILNKPAGIVCHCAGKYQGDSIISRLHRLRGDHIRLIHRLDQGTSGVLLAALTPACVKSLAIQFERRRITKDYLALVSGYPPCQEEIIDMPMLPDPCVDAILKNRMVYHLQGLPSSTKYSLLKGNEQLSLLYLAPFTGRKHQIRFHLALRGIPLLGETLYIHQGLPFLWEHLFSRPSPWHNFSIGHALHAWSIRFFHPIKRQSLRIFAPLPVSWNPYLDKLGIKDLSARLLNLK